MSGRVAGRVAPLLVAGVLSLAACGSSADAGPEAGAPAAPTTSAAAVPVDAPTAPKAARSAKPDKPAPAVSSAGTGPSTAPAPGSGAAAAAAPATGAKAEANPTWRADTVAALRRIDPRLVADERATVAVVASTCKRISGMFSGKAVEIVRARFSTPQLPVTDSMAREIYRVILAKACYTM